MILSEDKLKSSPLQADTVYLDASQLEPNSNTASIEPPPAYTPATDHTRPPPDVPATNYLSIVKTADTISGRYVINAALVIPDYVLSGMDNLHITTRTSETADKRRDRGHGKRRSRKYDEDSSHRHVRRSSYSSSSFASSQEESASGTERGGAPRPVSPDFSSNDAEHRRLPPFGVHGQGGPFPPSDPQNWQPNHTGAGNSVETHTSHDDRSTSPPHPSQSGSPFPFPMPLPALPGSMLRSRMPQMNPLHAFMPRPPPPLQPFHWFQPPSHPPPEAGFHQPLEPGAPSHPQPHYEMSEQKSYQDQHYLLAAASCMQAHAVNCAEEQYRRATRLHRETSSPRSPPEPPAPRSPYESPAPVPWDMPWMALRGLAAPFTPALDYRSSDSDTPGPAKRRGGRRVKKDERRAKKKAGSVKRKTEPTRDNLLLKTDTGSIDAEIWVITPQSAVTGTAPPPASIRVESSGGSVTVKMCSSGAAPFTLHVSADTQALTVLLAPSYRGALTLRRSSPRALFRTGARLTARVVPLAETDRQRVGFVGDLSAEGLGNGSEIVLEGGEPGICVGYLDEEF